MTTTIARVASCLWLPMSMGKLKHAYVTRTVTFIVEPIDYKTAAAHLTISYPHGRIAFCGKRGTRGGWINLRCANDPNQLVRTKHATYHLVTESP